MREGMRLHPGTVWFARSLAQTRLQQADYTQAAQILKAGLTPQAEAADWALYASTLARLGRHEDTAGAYREAIRRDATQGSWWIGLGLALEQGGHPQEARDAFNRALQTPLSGELRDFASRKAGAQ
jgi:MSHA biogenesis protein MshN